MPRKETSLDSGVVVVTLAAAAAVFVACLCGVGWIRPPLEGAGPWLSAERLQTTKIIAVVAGGVVVLCVARAVWIRSTAPMWAAAGVIAIVAMLGAALYFEPAQARLETIGFDDDGYRVAESQELTFYNTTGTDMVICLGIRGDCDAEAKGPDRLRSPGLVVPPDHRLAVTMPGEAAYYRITIATPAPGIIRRDATVETYFQNTVV